MIPTKPPPFFKYPDKWSEEFKDFVKSCLVKNPEQRITAQSLLTVRNKLIGSSCLLKPNCSKLFFLEIQ